MKVFYFVLLLLISQTVQGRDIECFEQTEYDYMEVRTTATFSSTTPSFQIVHVINETGLPALVTRKVILSQSNVCGIDLDFNNQCKSQEKADGGQYSFTFKCNNKVEGEIYFDEFGSGHFRCEFPNQNTDHTYFFGCNLNQL